MRTIGPAIAVLVALVGCAGVNPSTEAPELAPGEYRLVLRATTGRQAGRSAVGRLHLEAAIAGQRGDIVLWGWTDIDFLPVGAPMLDEATPPLSHDPQAPGVVVVGSGVRSSLWIGSALNAPELIEDGGGIVLRGSRLDSRGLRGRWEQAGIVRAGRGTFVLTRILNR